MPESPPLRYSLLDEPLFGIEDDAGHRQKVTLPGLLARLSRGEPTALTAVQAHQQHPVHAFLVQLAALALARAGEGDIAHDETQWRDLLLATAKADGAGPEAFALVVGDLKRPAFLQPPVPEGTVEALKSEHALPSAELDVLITAKNHDVKIDRITQPEVEHWVFALLTLQTMQGFLGAGNYGIARMNGGFSSRPCVAYAPDQGQAPRFLRDVRVLLEGRASLEDDHGFGSKGHLGLVWCAPWNGATSLGFAELDPFFIEVCRRVRLTQGSDGSILAHRGSSKAARIDAKASTGNTGDPWTPVKRADGKALTMSEDGFTYARVQDLLFGDWAQGLAGRLHTVGQDAFWIGQVLVRGQGKTEGYHERWLPVPPKARSFLARPDAREKLGKRAAAWVEKAREARLKVLKPALLTLLQGGPETLKFDDNRPDRYLGALDAAIDAIFFHLLFEHLDDPVETAHAAFETKLVELARAQLDAAKRSLPVPTARRYRAEAYAERAFSGAARRLFQYAFPPAPAPSAQGDSP